jgi:hypothetical protein
MVCYYWMLSDTNRSVSTMFIVAISSGDVAISSGEEEITSNSTDKPTNYLSVLNANFTAPQIQQSTLTTLFPALNRMICNIHAVVTTTACGTQVSVLSILRTLYVEQNYNGLILWQSKLSSLSPCFSYSLKLMYLSWFYILKKSVVSPPVISHNC